MAELISDTLTNSLMDKLQGVQYSLFATIDHETGSPAVNAISWIYALNSRRIRIAVGHRSRMLEHVKRNPAVAVTLIGPDTTYEITGRASITEVPMTDVSIKLACIEIEVEAVKNVMYFGAKIVQGVECAKTYDQEKADQLDQQVLSALKK
ncbi:pyridoxamine 5'-phosphate oxidase family protein [Marininema halotolerans]|uniref:Pyridoxamine 5'-phosphate oxidase n=1 Tax=Marininema halotolerans TaxID=1155944 RepID=A0A1I6QAQ2_9BACL|nr:pyridoxamine 5'-phosphate oxidase family protein [Marininema halotolerans]SFS49547.1 Pyridoxamine 5'-phosphate oxidase [Marininema halotolerans]